NYAFTTLEPNLGIVEVRDHKSFVMADIPGIIEGAHEGRGLGTRFLRHIERNSVLLFMIPADSDDIRRDYDILLGELTQYNPELLDKERLLAVTKCDMLDDGLLEELRAHSIVKKGNNVTTVASEAQTLIVKARPAAPTKSEIIVTQPSVIGGKGTIAGIADTMEYSTNNGINWTTGDGDDIGDIEPGTT
ncbi:Obg family GTPase CgtA, partial [human gut metagenome]